MTQQELRDYQTASWATAIYPDKGKGTSIYPYLKLCGEAGEVAEMFGKRMRDGVTDEAAWRLSMLKELGDVLWYCAAIATECGRDLRSEPQNEYHHGHRVLMLCEAAVDGDANQAVGIVRLIAEGYGSTLAEVAAMNLAKLAKRQATGTLQGSGSDREDRVEHGNGGEQ